MASSPPDSDVYSIGTFRVHVILAATRYTCAMCVNCFKSLSACVRSVILIDDDCWHTRGRSSLISMFMLSITLRFDQPNDVESEFVMVLLD
jgi:hypothetical protein